MKFQLRCHEIFGTTGTKSRQNCMISIFLSHWCNKRVWNSNSSGRELVLRVERARYKTQIFEPRRHPVAKYLFVPSVLKISQNLPRTHKNLRNYVNTSLLHKHCKCCARVHSASRQSPKETTIATFMMLQPDLSFRHDIVEAFALLDSYSNVPKLRSAIREFHYNARYKVIIWIHWLYGLFTSHVLKFNTVRFGNRIGPRLHAFFFQNKCYHLIIIYTVIKHGAQSNY